MNKKAKILIIYLSILAIIGITLFILVFKNENSIKVEENTCISDNCVSRVIDGDTFMLRTGEYVRLICINTPERTDAGYFEATKFLQQLIENKEVRLEKDISETDKYNRLLRYVYINDSSGKEIFVNRELVQQGFAVIWRYPPDVKRCDEIAA